MGKLSERKVINYSGAFPAIVSLIMLSARYEDSKGRNAYFM
jgi:hypothetical protein